MLSANPLSTRFTTTALAVAMIAGFGLQLRAQEAPAVHVGYARITGLPDDWTHHHLVFSNPGTEEDAIKKGTHEQWLRTVNEPRYVIHEMKRHLPVQGQAADEVKIRYGRDREDAEIRDRWDGRRHKKPGPNLVGSTLGGLWTMDMGNSGHMGAGQYPAKFNYSTASALCSDFVIFPTGNAGGLSQATMVAYSNIYSSCWTTGQTGPSVAWAYNTAGTATLSPVLSYDGTQVAFVQSGTTLVLLKPGSGGTVINPGPVTPESTTNYTGCGLNCYTTLTLHGGTSDTNSAPYYDYDNDILYVGDDSGNLHKFNPVFKGTIANPPAEVTTGGWPVSVSANKLTGPVLEPVSTLIFVGDSGGFLYSVTTTGSSSQTVVQSGQISLDTTIGIVDSPLIDSDPASPVVYVFSGDSAGSGSNHRTAVYQLATNFGSGTSGVRVFVANGSGNSGQSVYGGSFDNIHYNAITGNTGNLYFCGYDTTPRSQLYQIVLNATFSSSTLNTVGTAASAAGACSPATEFLGTKVSTTISAVFNSAEPSTTANGAVTSPTVNTTTINQTGFTAASTSVIVNSVTSIAAGNDIQIGTELIHVSSVNVGTKTLTITRGEFGTTPAADANGTTVTILNSGYSLPVASAANLVVAAGDFITDGTEMMYVTGVSTNTLTVIRGVLSTQATHTTGSTITNITANVASTSGVQVGDYIQVDSEDMLVDAVGLGGTTLGVTQAQLGTTAAAHSNGAVANDIQDWIYAGFTAGGSETVSPACTGACLYNYLVTSGTAPAGATHGIAANGGTSGIIIDNANTTVTGASQIYFGTLGTGQTCAGNGTFTGNSGNGTGSCAVQASQSGLQ